MSNENFTLRKQTGNVRDEFEILLHTHLSKAAEELASAATVLDHEKIEVMMEYIDQLRQIDSAHKDIFERLLSAPILPKLTDEDE